jgi:hypothetical protein
MGSNELLGVYLNDHLAGATAGVELAEKLAAGGEGTPFGTALAAVARDIREDKDVLEGLVERLGAGKSTVKQAAGWVFEKVTRLRFNRQLTGSEDLTRLLEVETLSLGIEGKLSLWRALREAPAPDAGLGAADFDRLIARALGQREALEPHRLAAAAEAFSP